MKLRLQDTGKELSLWLELFTTIVLGTALIALIGGLIALISGD